jgi:minor histocompatibility antigen H13
MIPGIFVALALRLDVSRGVKNRYFNSAFLGYTAGMTVTIVVMNWFQAAQVSSVTFLVISLLVMSVHL